MQIPWREARAGCRLRSLVWEGQALRGCATPWASFHDLSSLGLPEMPACAAEASYPCPFHRWGNRLPGGGTGLLNRMQAARDRESRSPRQTKGCSLGCSRSLCPAKDAVGSGTTGPWCALLRASDGLQKGLHENATACCPTQPVPRPQPRHRAQRHPPRALRARSPSTCQQPAASSAPPQTPICSTSPRGDKGQTPGPAA